MSNKTEAHRDAFTFSLAGLRSISSFAFVPVLADDRLNEAIGERLRRERAGQPDSPNAVVRWGRFWLRRRRRVA